MVGAGGESVFIRNCSDCTFYVACKQLRLRDCENVKLSLYSQTEPVIELSSGVEITPFSGGFEGQADCMRSANLDPEVNFWWGVYDFNDTEKTGKNFTVSAEPLEPWWPLGEATQVCAMTAPDSAPLPSTQGDGAGGGLAHGRDGPSIPGADGGDGAAAAATSKAFDIRTGQAAAQEAVDAEAATARAASVTLLGDETLAPDAAWTAHKVGVRYDPPLLALEFSDEAGVVHRKDIPFPDADELAAVVAEVDDEMCAAAVLDTLVDKHGPFLDFENLFSKRQVLRLIDMILQGGPGDF